MPVLRALGLGILIVVLASLAPDVLTQGKATVIAILRTIEHVAAVADFSSTAASPSLAPLFTPPTLPSPPGVR